MAGMSIMFLLFLSLIFLCVEAVSIGFLISGIIVAISFFIIKKMQKEKIGNKVAIPICLITLGITGLLPLLLLLITSLFY